MNPKDYAAHWIATHVTDARLARTKARNLAAIGHRKLAHDWRQHATELMGRARALKNELKGTP
jgi:hypothetical protein